MEMTIWAPEHSAALHEYLTKGMSFAEAAKAINERFNTAYSRSAALGRARRLGMAGPPRPEAPPHLPPPTKMQEGRLAASRSPEFHWPKPAFEPAEPVKLRCIEITPRHLSLIELERSDCRYPYGGDAEGEAITFCGHRRRPGSSYCTPHFHLSRDPNTSLEGSVSVASLKVVEAA